MREIENKIQRGHLTSEKVTDLLNEHDFLEKELKKSPEYRLFKFKKTHNL